jgi:hypothetical protein
MDEDVRQRNSHTRVAGLIAVTFSNGHLASFGEVPDMQMIPKQLHFPGSSSTYAQRAWPKTILHNMVDNRKKQKQIFTQKSLRKIYSDVFTKHLKRKMKLHVPT